MTTLPFEWSLVISFPCIHPLDPFRESLWQSKLHQSLICFRSHVQINSKVEIRFLDPRSCLKGKFCQDPLFCQSGWLCIDRKEKKLNNILQGWMPIACFSNLAPDRHSLMLWCLRHWGFLRCHNRPFDIYAAIFPWPPSTPATVPLACTMPL